MLSIWALTNRLTLHSSRYQTATSGKLVKATNLYRLLWGKRKTLRDRIFPTKSISVPTFQPDGSQDYSYTELSLRTSITEFLQSTPREDPEMWLNILPCKSDALVFREAYREMLDFIKGLEEKQGYMGEGKPPQRARNHASIILTGNPGIGKTWFQSAILVDRLLAGLPTVLQTYKGRGDAQFLLFYQHGVVSLHELAPNDPVYRNVEVWALADQQARGILEDSMAQEWLIVVTSSPREENIQATPEGKWCSCVVHARVGVVGNSRSQRVPGQRRTRNLVGTILCVRPPPQVATGRAIFPQPEGT